MELKLGTQESKNASSEIITINSRFGEITVDISKAVFFPNGLPGFPKRLHFVLTNFTKQGYDRFKILQCLNDISLSFVVIPASLDNEFVERVDLEEVLKLMNLPEEEAGILFIVSVEKTPQKTKLTVNAKAPVIIDTKGQCAVQYIINDDKYNVRTEI
jgi:flagellar assembly factor FliW